MKINQDLYNIQLHSYMCLVYGMNGKKYAKKVTKGDVDRANNQPKIMTKSRSIVLFLCSYMISIIIGQLLNWDSLGRTTN